MAYDISLTALGVPLDRYQSGIFVPYTGATSDVDLGSQDLTTTGNITGGNIEATNSMGIDSPTIATIYVDRGSNALGREASFYWQTNEVVQFQFGLLAAAHSGTDNYLTLADGLSNTLLDIDKSTGLFDFQNNAITTGGVGTFGSVKGSDLSSGSVVYAGTDGLLTTGPYLTFDGNSLVFGTTTQIRQVGDFRTISDRVVGTSILFDDTITWSGDTNTGAYIGLQVGLSDKRDITSTATFPSDTVKVARVNCSRIGASNGFTYTDSLAASLSSLNMTALENLMVDGGVYNGSVGDTTLTNKNTYQQMQVNLTCNVGAKTITANYYGNDIIPSFSPTLTAGTLNVNVYPFRVTGTGPATGKVSAFTGASFYTSFATGTAGGTYYGYQNASAMPNFMGNDNSKSYFGTGVDASIYYDGTNLVINPKDVGSGLLSILGSVSASTNVSAQNFTAQLNYGYYWTNADDRIVVDSSHNMSLRTNGADAVTILANGNVGIGVTNPVFPLVVKDVNKTGHAQDWQKSTGAVFAYADATNSALSSVYFHLGNGGSGQWYPTKLSGISTFQVQWSATANASNPPDVGIKRHGVNVLEVNNGTAGQLATLVAGNVGIGTTAPDYILDIRKATSEMQLKSTTGSNYVAYRLNNTSGNMYIGLDSSTGGGLSTGSTAYNGVINVAGNYGLQFGTNNTVRVTIDNAGQVGIGVASPGYNLDVQSAAQASINIQGPTNPYLRIYDTDGNGVFTAQCVGANVTLANGYSQGQLRLATQSIDALVIDKDQNIDIPKTLTVNTLVLDSVTSDPGSPADGSAWYRSDTDEFRFRADGKTYKMLVERV